MRIALGIDIAIGGTVEVDYVNNAHFTHSIVFISSNVVANPFSIVTFRKELRKKL